MMVKVGSRELEMGGPCFHIFQITRYIGWITTGYRMKLQLFNRMQMVWVDIAEFIAFQEFIFGQDIEILQHQKRRNSPWTFKNYI